MSELTVSDDQPESSKKNLPVVYDTVEIQSGGVEKLRTQITQLKEFVQSQLQPDIDYGLIPGCVQKPSLFKPGAEKLAALFSLGSRIVDKHHDIDWKTGVATFIYTVEVYSLKTGNPVSQCEGVACSKEKKYEKTPMASNLNTLAKMSQKRAYVGAVISATRASDFFTQDVEDMDFGNRKDTKMYFDVDLPLERMNEIKNKLYENSSQLGECINYGGSKNSQGYGTISFDARSCLAHRLAYFFKYGPFEDGMLILHNCDNPSCINPDHLKIGTPRENAQDAARRGRTHKVGSIYGSPPSKRSNGNQSQNTASYDRRHEAAVSKPISEKQLKMLGKLVSDLDWDDDYKKAWLKENYGVTSRTKLNIKQASEAIDRLLKMVASMQAHAGAEDTEDFDEFMAGVRE